jgi:leader peptidase (prepilin peptidase)/N-methyltransferase
VSESLRGDDLSASPAAPGAADSSEGAPVVSTAPEARFDWIEPVIRRRPHVALVTVAVLGLVGWRIGPRPELLAFGYLCVVGVVLSFIDVALHRLPDPLTLPSYAVGAALLGVAAPFTANGGTRYLHALTGLGALLLLFAVQWFVVPSAIGLGDVKLSGVLGLYLGWLGSAAWVMGVFGMFVVGGVYAVGLLVTRRATRKTAIPFGPFMLAGALVAVLLYGPGW